MRCVSGGAEMILSSSDDESDEKLIKKIDIKAGHTMINDCLHLLRCLSPPTACCESADQGSRIQLSKVSRRCIKALEVLFEAGSNSLPACIQTFFFSIKGIKKYDVGGLVILGTCKIRPNVMI